MKRSKMKPLLLPFLSFGLLAPLVSATDFIWKANCPQGTTDVFSWTWCEADWNDPDAWTAESGYPDDGADNATLRCNTSTGGSGDWHRVNLSTVTVGTLTIKPTTVGDSACDVSFWGNATVTCTKVTIDGANGPVQVIAGAGAKIQTN